MRNASHLDSVNGPEWVPSRTTETRNIKIAFPEESALGRGGVSAKLKNLTKTLEVRNKISRYTEVPTCSTCQTQPSVLLAERNQLPELDGLLLVYSIRRQTEFQPPTVLLSKTFVEKTDLLLFGTGSLLESACSILLQMEAADKNGHHITSL